MKKNIKIILISGGTLIALWFIGQSTNAFRRLSTGAVANYPAIRKGEGFFVSNLKKPARFDFICHYAASPYTGRHLRVFRVCGLEGDKIEIRKGNLYVNDVYADDKLSLAHHYILPATEWERAKKIESVDNEFASNTTSDSVITYLSDHIVSTHAIKCRRIIAPADEKSEGIEKQYQALWNMDNFGPVIVPEGKYFVLGDNRSFAEDSRYTGFVDKSDYVATVLGK